MDGREAILAVLVIAGTGRNAVSIALAKGSHRYCVGTTPSITPQAQAVST